VRSRIAAACARCGRDPAAVTLIGASKRQAVGRLREALAAGLEVLGENQVQEAIGKSAELPAAVDWHMIGPLQSNKVRAAARLFSTVHSLDRDKIAHLLDQECAHQGRRLRGFVQVRLGSEESKHGYPETGFCDRVRGLVELAHVDVVGLMAIPPWEDDLERARAWFRRLRELRDRMAERPEWRTFPGWLSMGMSHDFEVAIEEGATHVRVGTALFGPRG